MTILIYGAPETTPDLFHVIPEGVVNPFLYIETDDARHAAVDPLNAPKISALGIEVLDHASLGADELLASGASQLELDLEIALRACRAIGVDTAIAPPGFPLGVADHLRSGGVTVAVDGKTFADRRRGKTDAQLRGIRRAQEVAEKAMALAAQLIRELPSGLTSEQVRQAMQRLCNEHGCDLPEMVIVAPGAQGADCEASGTGEIEAGASVVVDIWPRDRASHCWADMTRTFVAGGVEPSARLRRDWELTRDALESAAAAVRPGVEAQRLWELSCEPYEAEDIPTLRTKPDGSTLMEGFYHPVGHGVGLEIHEAPTVGAGPDELVFGDVITIEPGCYRPGISGVRLEDLLLVREGGRERLTDFPYDL